MSVSSKSTYRDPIGVLEELLEHDIALDVLQHMLSMIQEKLDDEGDDWENEDGEG